MSLKDIENIPRQKLASDLPDEIVGTVTAAERTTISGTWGQQPALKLTLKLEDGIETVTVYRIPKALTGKGQMDLLLKQLDDIGIRLQDITGQTFLWHKMSLPGAMKGNPRHYPVELVE